MTSVLLLERCDHFPELIISFNENIMTSPLTGCTGVMLLVTSTGCLWHGWFLYRHGWVFYDVDSVLHLFDYLGDVSFTLVHCGNAHRIVRFPAKQKNVQPHSFLMAPHASY